MSSSVRRVVVNLNDRNDINRLSESLHAAEGLDSRLTQPIQDAISCLENHEVTHDLDLDQIQAIFDRLRIDESMSPEEMEHALVTSRSVAVIEKKYLKTSMRRTAFSVMIQSILQHFAGVVSGQILSALTQVIENYACICMMKQSQASYKNVCFKFFARSKHSNEVLVLLLNIHYEEASWKYKMLNFFRFRRELMHLNFLGALVRTDLQPARPGG